MASAYVEVILGVAVGVTAGVVPALLVTVAGGAVPSLVDRPFARVLVALLAVPAAVLVGLATDQLSLTADQAPRILAGGTVAALLAAFGFTRGSALGSTVRSSGWTELERGQSLSGDVLDAVDGAGQVVIRPAGRVETVDGYPELPAELRDRIAGERWRLPADLPLSELEDRIRRQLEAAYDLDAVSVTLDPKGTATVTAGAPVTGIAHRVPEDHRAVSIATAVPEGTVAGDRVVVETATATVEGIVLGSTPLEEPRENDAIGTGDGVERTRRSGPALPADGHGRWRRLTIAVPTSHADALLADRSAPVAVRSRDTRPDYRALSLLDRADQSVRMTTVDEQLLGELGDVSDDVGVFAAAPGSDAGNEDWTFGPSVASIEPGWQVILVGDDTTLDLLLDEKRQVKGAIDA